MNARVPQGSNLARTLYNIYTLDIPHNDATSSETFADDTGTIDSDKNPDTASFHRQHHLNELQSWFIMWKIKIN